MGTEQFSLAPLDGEIAASDKTLPSLQDALHVRDVALLERRHARQNTDATLEAFGQAAGELTRLQNMNPLVRTMLGITGDTLEKAQAAVTVAQGAHVDATVSRQSAERALHVAHQDVLAAAHAHYEALLKDKRTGFDAIPCSQWRADAPDEAPYCHCNQVPGNTLGELVPHNQENYQGKPWCAACQTAECGGPHPVVSLEQFVQRFALGA